MRALDFADAARRASDESLTGVGPAKEVLSSPRLDKRRSRYRRTRELKMAESVEVYPHGSAGIHYAELHCHSNYSFKEGASGTDELVVRAKELGLTALALTDHDNLCGAMEFAQAAKQVGLQAIIGVELTLTNGHHLTLLAENREGYKNISRLTTRAHMDPEQRDQPALTPSLLADYAEGVICLSGCRQGEIASLVTREEIERAKQIAAQYLDWFGPQRYFIELQQNLVWGDSFRNERLAEIAEALGIPTVATGNVHYHVRERSHLNDVLVAIQHNRSLDETHQERRPNNEFYLPSPKEMSERFARYPEAIANTVRIAERCDFDLTEALIYQFPDYEVPEGYTPISWLRRLCENAAQRKYGGIDQRVQARLDEELRLLEKHDLAGFMLQYHDIIQIAREIQEELGLVDPLVPVESHPPGRGRGSSVALLTGYLIGLSHIDPLQFDLKLERFLSEEIAGPPDIDLDFPRDIREELILRVHQRRGYEHAVLTGMISTYRVRGAIRDLGKAFGLPEEDLDKLAKRVDGHGGVRGLAEEMGQLPEFRDRMDAPLWRDLLSLAIELEGFPKYLAQHPGGMVLSARPLSEVVPLQRSAIDGRYICQWDKDSADDAGFVKIDFLALGALSQMNEAVRLIGQRTEWPVDLSRIDFTDEKVYDAIHRSDTIGVFQIESAAQMQTVTRLKPTNLKEMAWEVGAVRPGVGVHDGVTRLIRRHTGLEQDWNYDHPLEKKALERTLGVVLFQDQLMELGMHVAGLSPADADRMRRAFGRRNAKALVGQWHERFLEGAMKKGVPPEVAEKIFHKFHGEFQFPESHAFAFGVTAFQAAWLKVYYPLEFYTGLFNQQPMGFYNLETLKEDAARHDVTILNPDVNISDVWAKIEDHSLRLGFRHVRGVQETSAKAILESRSTDGPFLSLADFMRRTGARREVLDNLAEAGAFDSFDPRASWGHNSSMLGELPNSQRAPANTADRRGLQWEIGLRYRPVGRQLAFDTFSEADMVALPDQSAWERMAGEYRTLGLYPSGHVMAMLRPRLPKDVIPSSQAEKMPDGREVRVAGVVIRRQRPLAKAVFITLEDEFGHSPLVIWPQVYERLKRVTKESVLIARGTVSRRDGTMNIVVKDLEKVTNNAPTLPSKDWG